MYVPFVTGNFQNVKPEFSVEWRNLRCQCAFMILSFNFQAEYNKDQHHITLELSVKDLEVSLQIIVFALLAPFLALIAALESLFLASIQHSADYRNLRKDTDLKLFSPWIAACWQYIKMYDIEWLSFEYYMQVLHQPRYRIGLKHSRNFFIQSKVKPKPIVSHSHSFSRSLRQLRVITSSFDWFSRFCLCPL